MSESVFTPEKKTLFDILLAQKLTVHYYQRDYRWQRRQIIQLLDDLFDAFPYNEGDGQESVLNYPSYYMGSVIEIGDKKDLGFHAIIDGQQRLTSFTLILIYLLNTIREKNISYGSKNEIELMVKRHSGSKETFNFFFGDGRDQVLESLYKGLIPEKPNGDSAITMVNRYKDIRDYLDEKISDEMEFRCFCDWLKNNILFIMVLVDSEQDAYKMFVSMNDRGLCLTDTEMLKGYLLSKITDDGKRKDSDDEWKTVVSQLRCLNERKPDEPDNDQDKLFFIDFLRSKYATTLREGSEGAEDKDYELIGKDFHQWVFENASGPSLNLRTSEDFYSFINHTIKFYSDQYIRIDGMGLKLTAGFESVYYNRWCGITYQTMLIISALNETDSEDVVDKKIKLVSCFVECFYVRRLVNWSKSTWNSNKYFLFKLMLEIRGKDMNSIGISCGKAIKRLENEQGKSLANIHSWKLNQMNGKQMKYMLSRWTSFIDEKMGFGNTFEKYENWDPSKGKTYDKEHVLANDFKAFGAEFGNVDEFSSWRNRIGNLVLLAFDKNRSWGADPVDEKVKHYITENPLAASFNAGYYGKNPSFDRIKDTFGFKPYSKMGKQEIEERSFFYEKLSQNIWGISRLEDLSGGWDKTTEELVSHEGVKAPKNGRG